jgi:hypothetical protein
MSSTKECHELHRSVLAVYVQRPTNSISRACVWGKESSIKCTYHASDARVSMIKLAATTRKTATRSAPNMVTHSAWAVRCGYHATGK